MGRLFYCSLCRHLTQYPNTKRELKLMLFFLHEGGKNSWYLRFVLRIFLVHLVFWRHAVPLRLLTVFSQYLLKTLESANQPFIIAFTIIHNEHFPELSGLGSVFLC